LVNDLFYIIVYICEKSKGASARVFPIGAVTKGLRGEELASIGGMIAEGAVAISDDGMTVMNSYLMRKAMDYAKSFGIPIISHAEDTHLVGQGVMNEGPVSTELGLRGNPAAAEEIIVAREIALCRLTGARVHIAHLSTAVALEHVRRAKSDGLPITCEVTPHHLSLTDDAVRGYDTCCKMRPPLRSKADIEALIGGLADGTIDMIATDHAPHGEIDKEVEFDRAANGIIGLQTATAITYELVDRGRVPLERWVDALTARPAKLIGVPHGTLKVGAAADVVVFDPKAEWKFDGAGNRSKSDNSPYLGRSFRGRVETTLLAGRTVYEWK
jgi:dihydroorotase